MMHFLPLKSLLRDYKISAAVTFVSFAVIMGENLKINSSVAFVKNWVFSIISLLLELPEIMELWKGRTGLLRSLLEPF